MGFLSKGFEYEFETTVVNDPSVFEPPEGLLYNNIQAHKNSAFHVNFFSAILDINPVNNLSFLLLLISLVLIYDPLFVAMIIINRVISHYVMFTCTLSEYSYCLSVLSFTIFLFKIYKPGRVIILDNNSVIILYSSKDFVIICFYRELFGVLLLHRDCLDWETKLFSGVPTKHLSCDCARLAQSD